MRKNLRLSCSYRIFGADTYNQDIVFGAVTFLPERSVSNRSTDYGKGFAHLCEDLPVIFDLWG